MRYAWWVVLLLVALTFGCSRSTEVLQEEGDPVIPAHIERTYAAMSVPAFAADGSLYVANGRSLLHYSADGQRLGETSLPVNIDASWPMYTLWPRLCATSSGEIYATLGDERLARLGPDGQPAWLQPYLTRIGYPEPFANGVLVERYGKQGLGVSFIDATGKVGWEVPGALLYPNVVQVDEQGRAYFRNEKQLSVLLPDGSVLAQRELTDAINSVDLCNARQDRVLVRVDNDMVCLNIALEQLWKIEAPNRSAICENGFVLSPDRFVVLIDRVNNREDAMSIYNANGQLVYQFPNSTLWYLMTADDTGFLVYSYYDPDELLAAKETWIWCDLNGHELWHYHPPARENLNNWVDGDTVLVRDSESGIKIGPDGRFYFERNSTLYVLSHDGEPLWQAAGTDYYDVSVPALPFL